MQRVTCVGLGHVDSDVGDDGGIDVDNGDGDGMPKTWPPLTLKSK